MPIKTGRYFIINVRTKNQAYLPNSNSAEPVQSTYQQDDPGEQWNIKDCKNGHHIIKNVGHGQFAASGNRSAVGEEVIGWEREQQWLIQKTRVEGKYTISTTDSKHCWGLVDGEQGTPIALAQAYNDRRNWWIFKEVETGKDAEVDPYLDNGRTAEDTAAGDIVLQAVLFELALPPASASKPFELDLAVIQEMHNEFIPNATETANMICGPLINSGQLNPSGLRIKFIEFESFETVSLQRLSGIQTFGQLQAYRGGDLPWIRCRGPVIPSALTKGIKDFRPSATKVVVLNLRSLPLRNGGQSLLKLIYQLSDDNVILILTLTEPYLPDTLVNNQLTSFISILVRYRSLSRISKDCIRGHPFPPGRRLLPMHC
ncbi:hypothetical protein BJ912DRAFT_963997 [Pholiota molesta]|nr:hypothetical protein BJ912DRAFT_963997 [Pholiota molesta]